MHCKTAQRFVSASKLAAILGCSLILANPFPANAQQAGAEPVAVERPGSESKSEPAILSAPDAGSAVSPAPAAPIAVAPEPAPELTDEERREQALERIADSLSERMRAILKRERTLGVREDAITERELALEARVRAIMSREASLEARENLVSRREQLPPPLAWEGPPPPNIVGKYAAVIDANTAQFYHLKDAEKLTPVASTQKLLTALIVINEGDLDRKIEVPIEVNDTEPTHIGIKPGQNYTRRELLRALLIRSGNDVAACLAVDNAGSIEAFAKKMNDFARYIGATNSNFVNPHGLPDDKQVSTAHDMALIAFEAYQDSFVRECVKTKSAVFTFNDGSVRTLTNTNKVLRDYENCNGMKTGYTIASGHCLISSGAAGEEGASERIVVVLGSNRTYVSKDSRALLEWALNLKTKDS